MRRDETKDRLLHKTNYTSSLSTRRDICASGKRQKL